MEYLAERGIGLEVCPTSNVLLGVYSSLGEHPLAQLVRRGLVVTVNTDTPAIFGISLESEFALLNDQFGLSTDEVEQVRLNAFSVSFDDTARAIAGLNASIATG